MRHICNGCGMSVTIPDYLKETKGGQVMVVGCQVCGKKSKVKIALAKDSSKGPTITQGGTVISRVNAPKRVRFKLIISNKHTGQTMVMKEINADTTYIVGRNESKIKQVNPKAEAILIPANFDPAVSRSHFELKIKKQGQAQAIVVRDLKSANKTFLYTLDGNKEILDADEQVYIDHNDKIIIGENTSITFYTNNL